MSVKLDIKGLDKLEKAIKQYPREIQHAFRGASKESYDNIMRDTPGLKKYPPATAANAPPTPYYIRGRGTQLKSRNTGSSERLGSQWYYQATQTGGEIGNRASYAKWVHGEEQASFMKPKGWRILKEVAEEKKAALSAIYQKWIDAALDKIFGR